MLQSTRLNPCFISWAEARVDREVHDIACKWWWCVEDEKFVDDQGRLRSYELSGADLDWLQDAEPTQWWQHTTVQAMYMPPAVHSVSWPGTCRYNAARAVSKLCVAKRSRPLAFKHNAEGIEVGVSNSSLGCATYSHRTHAHMCHVNTCACVQRGTCR